MIYVFGPYELHTESYELRRAGEPVQIEPKVFEVLAYLVQHQGQVVSKHELLERLWPDQFVSEAALSYCLGAARKAIGDTGRTQRFVKTVYGRGYHFIAPVETRQPQGETAMGQPVAVDAPWHGEEVPDRAQGVSHLPERRQLSVMFYRVVYATTLSAQLDPEEMHVLIRHAHQLCAEVIQRFEGHIAQAVGDGLMVYFGYPLAHEDDACRAVQTGLEIVETIARYRRTLERDESARLFARVGIHTGMAVVGAHRPDDESAQAMLGSTPNIVTQLQDLAEPDTVMISSSTYPLVERSFDCKAPASYILEAPSEPLEVYQVVQERTGQSPFEIAAALTPLVGREQEVGLILERWEHVKAGMGQVLLLSGEAGIGKSRLLHALKERMTADGYTPLEYRCSPYARHSAFYPVIEHVQQFLHWHRDDTEQEKLRKLETVLERGGFVLAEVVPLFAALLSLPCPDHVPLLTLTPQLQKQKTLEALLMWVLKEAESQPVCFIMEDLHWVDPSTLEFLSLLIEHVPTARVLVLLTFRPHFSPPRPVRSHATHIVLNHLTRAQVKTMVEGVTRGKTLPDGVLQQLVAKTDGVPLFVEEMTKMVLQSGLLQEKDETYELLVPLPSLAVPSTLHDSLMARLDRLGPGKQVAQLGAALGREFAYEVLQAISPMDEVTLRHELSCLVDAELLYQRGVSLQAQYVFKHVLIQEAAYQSLLRSTRQQYHGRIAHVLEERFPEIRERQPELLAHHYTEAGLSAQAIVYWQQAAQRAMERSAHLDAIAHVQHGLAALATLQDSPERGQYELTLQTTLGAALTFTRGWGASEVVRAFDRARELSEQIGDIPQLFTVLRGLWWLCLVRSELPAAYELSQRLLRLAEDHNDPALFVEAHRAAGTSLFFMGEQTAVGSHLERGLTLFEALPHRALTIQYGQDTDIMFLHYTAWNLWLRGYPDQAIDAMHQMLRRSQQRTHYSRSHALTMAAVLHQWRREIHAVYERVEASVALANEHIFPFVRALGTIFQGWVGVQQGQLEEGMAQMRRGVTAYRVMGAELVSTYMLALLAEEYWHAGHIEEGLRTLAEALILLDKHGERWWEAELYRLQAELLLQQSTPDVAQAETALQQALAVARKQQAKSLELRATMSLCRLWQQQGKRLQAHNMLREIYGRFTEGHDTADLKEAKTLLDDLE